jgi:hypothetical protein
MRICRDLGYTIAELRERMTLEELLLWQTLYKVEHDESKPKR